MRKLNSSTSGQSALSRFQAAINSRGNKRQQRRWTFEQLEQRQMLAVTPFGEELFNQQWYLLNTGQQVGNPDFQEILAIPGEDINVAPVWADGFTGAGVVIAIVDGGIQTSHPDLNDNISPFLQFDLLDDDQSATPNLADPMNARGTAVAGIIAAENNGEGTVGVAYEAQIVPVRLIDPLQAATDEDFQDMLELYTNDIDIFVHPWAFDDARTTSLLTEDQLQALSDSVISGRDGLGVIHVKAAGNDAGPITSPGFTPIGNWDSANYDGWAASRFMIAVAGVDHDGEYNNFDGSVTSYAAGGSNILIAAPIGSFGGVEIVDDLGIGSGLYTTDALGDDGFNISPLPNGIEIDRDFHPDPDYTSRFTGTEAAAGMVSGVIALMLQANPNLSWRDVQEILVRSARQNAQFEAPTTGFGFEGVNTWTTNRNEIFREPDVPVLTSPAPLPLLVDFPITDPNFTPLPPLPDQFDPEPTSFRSFEHFSATPDVLMNGAGYTVSQGRGSFGEALGYGHGTVDAELAVDLARQWTTTNQTLPPERTFTTFAAPVALNLPALEKGNDDTGSLLIPGKPGGRSGFAGYYNIFYSDEPDFSNYNGPTTSGRYIPLEIPDSNAMTIETVSIKLDLSGNADDLDHVRVTLVSPDGTHSELNNHFDVRPGIGSFRKQGNELHAGFITNPPGTLDPDGGNFTWTFTSNRFWGERHDFNPQIDPTTGEPYPGASQFFGNNIDWKQGWELHIENYSASAFVIDGIEVAWHGSPIDSDSGRVQGFVGLDDNRDTLFNFERWTQQHFDIDGDNVINRLGEVERTVDETQESFASNVLVTVRRTGETEIVDQFLTGADGNFYFDLVPDFYTISIEDPLGRTVLDDPNAPSGFLPKYRSEWNITPDYFNALDHDRLPAILSDYDPVTDYDIRVDGAGNPFPYSNPGTGGSVRADLTVVNFLLDPDDPTPPSTVLNGFAFADLEGNGVFDGQDVVQEGIEIFADLDSDGLFDPDTEPSAKTIADGTYSLLVTTQVPRTIDILPIPPAGWTVTLPERGSYTVFGAPGVEVNDLDFGLQPPLNERQLQVTGFVFNDLDGDGTFNNLDTGQTGVQVFADLNGDGDFDPDTEISGFTFGDGTFLLEVPTFEPISFDVRLILGEGGTITAPASEFFSVSGIPGDTIEDLFFGIQPPPALAGGITGNVFEDKNGDGQQDGDEFGAPGFQVFLDLNRNGVFNEGEPTTNSDVNGFFSFNDVTPGNVHVRIITPPEFDVTTPPGGLNIVSVPPAQVAPGVLFGVNNATMIGDDVLVDFGDLLGPGFPTLEIEGGAWHTVVEGFSLGARVDRELDGQPSVNADGDDNGGLADEDGVRIVNFAGSPIDSLGDPILIQPGLNRVEVVVRGLGGNLNAWMDFNGDGDWLDSGEQIFTNLDLLPGRYILPFFAPGIPEDELIASRFRWGEADLSFFGGSLFAGEVEDYKFVTTNRPTVNIVPPPGDYDGSGHVNMADYDMYKSSFGSTSNLAADGNMNGVVDSGDYLVWLANLGAGTESVAAASASVNATSYAPTVARPTAEDLAAAEALVNSFNSVLQVANFAETAEASQTSSSLSFVEPTTISSQSAMSSMSVTQTSELSDIESEQETLLAAVLEDFDPRSLLETDEVSFDSQQESEDSDMALALALEDENAWRLL